MEQRVEETNVPIRDRLLKSASMLLLPMGVAIAVGYLFWPKIRPKIRAAFRQFAILPASSSRLERQ